MERLGARLNHDSTQKSKKNSGLASFGRFWPLFGSLFGSQQAHNLPTLSCNGTVRIFLSIARWLHLNKSFNNIDLTSCQSILVSYKTNNECFHSCNGKNIFIRWKMECSNQLGEAEKYRGIFLTIALINIHY